MNLILMIFNDVAFNNYEDLGLKSALFSLLVICGIVIRYQHNSHKTELEKKDERFTKALDSLRGEVKHLTKERYDDAIAFKNEYKDMSMNYAKMSVEMAKAIESAEKMYYDRRS